MKCPACDNKLSRLNVSGVDVDICKGGCGGVWFDTYEFKKFDEPHEHAGEELLEVERNPELIVDHSQKRSCPVCEGVTMMKHFHSVKKEVEIDECANCAGVWLDTGELAKIRSLFKTEEERSQAAEKVFSEFFGPQLEMLANESTENRVRARRVANMFKFICPSYYLKGKQDWGAF